MQKRDWVATLQTSTHSSFFTQLIQVPKVLILNLRLRTCVWVQHPELLENLMRQKENSSLENMAFSFNTVCIGSGTFGVAFFCLIFISFTYLHQCLKILTWLTPISNTTEMQSQMIKSALQHLLYEYSFPATISSCFFACKGVPITQMLIGISCSYNFFSIKPYILFQYSLKWHGKQVIKCTTVQYSLSCKGHKWEKHYRVQISISSLPVFVKLSHYVHS